MGTFSPGNGVYFSADSGVTWKVANTNLPSQEIWDFTYTGDKIIAGTDFSGIWYTPFTVDIPPAGGATSQPSISVYPNPATDLLTIEGGLHQQLTLTLFNSAGRELSKTILEGSYNSHKVNISSISNGLYIWKLTDNAGNVNVGKFLILK